MKDTHWFLLRGLGRETRHWGGFAQKLKKAASGVTCLELPGSGCRYKEKAPRKAEGYVLDLRKKFSAMRVCGRKALVGLSFGGMIAQQWRQLFPNDFERIVLINTSGGSLSPFYHRLRPSALATIFSLFAIKELKTREETILDLTTNMLPFSHELIESWVEYAREFPLRREMFLRQLMAAGQFAPEVKGNTPLFLLASEKDRLVNVSCSKKLATFHGAPLFLHPEAGHDLPLDDPDWVIEILREVCEESS